MGAELYGKSQEFQTIFGEGQHPLLAAAGSHVSNCKCLEHLQADCYCGNRPHFVKLGDASLYHCA